MVPIKFTSLALGILLVCQALSASLTQAHQAWAMNGNDFSMRGENALMVQKDLVDHGETKAGSRMIGLGGRKMVVGRVSRKGIKAEEEGLNQENSKISGKHSHASTKFVGKSSVTLNDQENLKSLEATKTWKCSRMSCASKPKAPAVPGQEPVGHTHTTDHHQREGDEEEAERLLKALNEIVNLIHKDYKGNDKPKRKPPINNREPSD